MSLGLSLTSQLTFESLSEHKIPLDMQAQWRIHFCLLHLGHNTLLTIGRLIYQKYICSHPHPSYTSCIINPLDFFSLGRQALVATLTYQDIKSESAPVTAPKCFHILCFLKCIKENTIPPAVSVSVTSTLTVTSISAFLSPFPSLVISLSSVFSSFFVSELNVSPSTVLIMILFSFRELTGSGTFKWNTPLCTSKGNINGHVFFVCAWCTAFLLRCNFWGLHLV